MSEKHKQLVFRCGWTLWRVLERVFLYGTLLSIGMPFDSVLLSLAALLACMVFAGLDILVTSRFIHSWRAELDFVAIRVTDAEGKSVTIRWEDVQGVTFFLFPDIRFRGGSITLPAGIINGRSLFATIAERAKLTSKERSWLTGVRLTRPR